MTTPPPDYQTFLNTVLRPVYDAITGFVTFANSLPRPAGWPPLPIPAWPWGLRLLSIEVTPASPALEVGQSLAFTATGTYEDGTTQDLTSLALWESSAPTVLSIGPGGVAQAVAAGSSDVTANYLMITSSPITTSVTVGPPPPPPPPPVNLVSLAVTPGDSSLEARQTLQYSATGTYSDGSSRILTGADGLVWLVVAGASLASIDQNGLLSAASPGSVTVRAAVGILFNDVLLTVVAAPPPPPPPPVTLDSVIVSPGSATLEIGQTQQFLATGFWSDGSSRPLGLLDGLLWESLEDTIVSINQSGLATALVAGTATIQVTIVGSTLPAVNVLVTVNPPPPPPPPPGPVDRIITGIQPAGFTVPAGEVWELRGYVEVGAPGAPASITNFGTLQAYGAAMGNMMGVDLHFVGVNEALFVGGAYAPITDPGIWNEGSGKCDFRGTPKRAWGYGLQNDPTWQPGDEIRVSPTDVTWFGQTDCPIYTPGTPLATWPDGKQAVTMNLTRDVKIRGNPGARPHLRSVSSQVSTFENVEFEYMGPARNDAQGINNGVLGRYPWHSHITMDASRGMILKGCVVKRSGQHAFVSHSANGVTHKEFIAYDIQGDAMWWDLHTASDDVVYEDGLVCRVNLNVSRRLSAYLMTLGLRNTVRRCTALGVNGEEDSSGAHWVEPDRSDPVPPGVWIFEDFEARQCRRHGIFTWQNDSQDHLVPTSGRVTLVNCGRSGIKHGAYVNVYKYSNTSIWCPPGAYGIISHALSGNTFPRPDGYFHSWENFDIHGGAGGIRIIGHVLPGQKEVLFKNISMVGQTGPKVTVNEREQDEELAGRFDLVDCSKEGGAALETSDVRIEFAFGQVVSRGVTVPAFRMRLQDTAGNRAWSIDNTGAVTAIPLFY